MSYETRLNKLIERAKALNLYSEKYAISLMYAERDSETSVQDIKLAVLKAGSKANAISFNEKMSILASSHEFRLVEKVMKEAASQMVNLQIEAERIYMLNPKESNEMLDEMMRNVKEQLFTKTKLSEIFS